MTQTASIRRDAVSRNGAFQFEEKLLSRRIVLIDHEGAIVMVTGMIYSHLFTNIGGTQQPASRSRLLRGATTLSRGIPTQSKMIQLVCGSSNALPHAQTETAGGRIASGIRDFCSVAVPLDISRIERRSIGRVDGEWVACIAFRHERKFPQPHDRRVTVAIPVATVITGVGRQRGQPVRDRS